MAIKVLLTLDNSDFKEGIADAQKTAADFVNKLSAVGTGGTQGAIAGATSSIRDFSVVLGGTTPAIREATDVTGDFAEGMRILDRVLRAAGVSTSEFAGFARLASVGIAGLATAIGGALVLAFANAEEKSKQLQAQLSSIVGAKAGGQAFRELKQGADDLNTSVAALGPTFATFLKNVADVQALSKGKFVGDIPPGALGNLDDARKAFEALIISEQASGQTAEGAQQKVTAFADAFGKAGKVTQDALKSLDAGTINAIAAALGRGFGDGQEAADKFVASVGQAGISLAQLLPALARIQPQTKTAFDDSGLKTYQQEFQGLVNDLSRGFDQLAGKPVSFSDALRVTLTNTRTEIQTIFDVLESTPVQTVFQGIGAAFTALVETFKGIAQAEWTLVLAVWQQLPDWSTIVSTFQSIMQQLVSAAQSAWDTIKNIFSQPLPQIAPGSGISLPPGGAAGGGLVIGPGTTTSDSILARLSNNEFVMNARATSFYGPGFMAALNAMMVPRDILPGFSVGGLVRAIAGATSFAQGGQARTPINLHIGRQVFGMFADDAVAAALGRVAITEQLASGGRSPGWRRT